MRSTSIRVRVITALVIGGAIFGLLGAILALPVTAAFRDVFKYVFRRASELGGARAGTAGRRRDAEVAAMEAAGARFATEVGRGRRPMTHPGRER